MNRAPRFGSSTRNYFGERCFKNVEMEPCPWSISSHCWAWPCCSSRRFGGRAPLARSIGVLVLALVTATGGGTLRDVLINRHPMFLDFRSLLYRRLHLAAAITWL